jgi:release factor glutamine methyltransferase
MAARWGEEGLAPVPGASEAFAFAGFEGGFDLILSNPPYIESGAIPGLMPEVKDFDPALALDGGADGLKAYRLLTPLAARLLKPGGFLLFEIGQGQADEVAALCAANGFDPAERKADLGGVERCVFARKRG